MSKDDVVGRLIANGPFTEDNRPLLEELTEEQLVALTEDGVKSDPNPKPEGDGGDQEKTEDEWLAEAPTSIRSMVTKYQAQEEAERTTLIGALTSAQSVYTEAQLKDKSTDDLSALARMLKLDEPTPDYSGRGVPSNDSSDVYSNPPDPYAEDLKKRQAAN